MSLAAAIAGAVRAASSTAESLKVEVQHAQWIGQSADGLGEPEFEDYPVPRRVVAQVGAKRHELPGGGVITTKARLFFLDPIEPDGAAGREEPIDPRDVFTLPSGVSGKVVEIPGAALNPESSPAVEMPYVRSVWLA